MSTMLPTNHLAMNHYLQPIISKKMCLPAATILQTYYKRKWTGYHAGNNISVQAMLMRRINKQTSTDT